MNNQDLDQYIDLVFSILKISDRLKGYHYLKSVITLRFRHPEYKRKIYIMLYPMVAAEYGTTVAGVERNIRTAIEYTWSREFSEEHYLWYSKVTSYKTIKPTATQFIEQTIRVIYDLMEKDEKESSDQNVSG